MKAYTFFCKITGNLHPTQIVCSDEKVLALNIPDGHGVLDGHHDHRMYRVDLVTGKLERTGYADQSALLSSPHEKLLVVYHRLSTLRNKSMDVLRELALGYDGAKERLRDLDDEIARLQGEL